MIKHIKASNILSFGPDGLDLELKPLNVLIGANGSGKSNFLEVISLIRSLPNDLQMTMSRGGGVNEWKWKGVDFSEDPFQQGNCEIDFTFQHPHPIGKLLPPIDYEFEFSIGSNSVYFSKEIISKPHYVESDLYAFSHHHRTLKGLPIDDKLFQRNLSILSQLKDPENHVEITALGEELKKIKIYKNWNFGKNTIFRTPQPADLRSDTLEEDFSNLGLFLNNLKLKPNIKKQILHWLSFLYDNLTDFEIKVEGGAIQLYFIEGDFAIPASRLSDGSLRYLCLLAILLDPNPPGLICIEEPELGLHPDILIKIADLLVEASERTQLIVTTHSDVIVDALTDSPESVLVCEKHQGRTNIRGLDTENIKLWLEDYRLGELWSRGQIGGNRW